MGRSSRAAGPDEIVELALHHLGMRDGIHYAPDIPPEKEAAARAVHAAHLPESEPILVLYDDTAFGGAKDGFVITPERVCWKNLFYHPRQVPWGEVDPATLGADGRHLRIAHGAVDASPPIAEGMVRFAGAMAERARQRDASPYREAHAEGAEGGAALRLVALARRHVGEVDDAYYHPAIPAAKLARARAVHAAHLPEDEIVAVLYDATVWGGAANGFLLTPARLCWKSISSEPRAITWQALDLEGVKVEDGSVHVMGGELFLLGQHALAAPVAGLFTAIAAKAQRDGGL